MGKHLATEERKNSHNANKKCRHSELPYYYLFMGKWEKKTDPLLVLSAGYMHNKSVITHRVVDVVKALAGWERVVGIDVFKPTNSQEHSDRRAKSKKRLRVESQLWVINGYLWSKGGVSY